MLFLILGCAASKESAQVIDEGDGRLIRLEPISPSPSYSHPVDLDLEIIRTALGSVVVSHPTSLLKRFFTQQSEVRGAAFSPKEIDLLAGSFKTAFARATPEERLAFFFTSRKSPMTMEVTSGVAFFKEKKLHLILANDHTEVSTEGRSWVRYDDPLRAYEVGSFAPIPQPHQKWMTPDALKGRQEEVVIDYEALASDPAPAVSEIGKGPAGSSSDDSKLEERLRLLKKLKDESLITDEEYTEKKKELLKTLH
jgi:hypothetical protein